ncbi:MAG: hypothetical protein JRI97_10370 [Deltaproteobacteria bacterium]|nr:hypothetical protein [Deltaproteobacteria bacterium]
MKPGSPKSKHHGMRAAAFRTITVLLGGVFLVAAAVKVADMALFTRQILDYGIVSSWPLAAAGAWGFVFAESILAGALLAGWRPREALWGTAALLLVFIGVTGWAWAGDGVDDCGCFGELLKRTPGQALAEDLVLLAIAAAALMLHRPGKPRLQRFRASVTVLFALAGLVLPWVFGLSFSALPRGRAGEAPPLGRVAILQGPEVDLSSGRWLLEIMDTGCDHCAEAVMPLNMVHQEPSMPRVAALSVNEPGAVEDFIARTGAEFPILKVAREDYLRLLGDGEIPRYILAAEGTIVSVWDGELPGFEELAPP